MSGFEYLRAFAQGDREREIMKVAAYLGRYGGQPVDTVFALPVSLALMLAEEVERLVREEAPPLRPEGGG